ncbi:TPA: hypothetical protein HA265_02215 [Candidatus Woesearchaeota archaeon]|nr:hypothetical protein [Candidatus Woesearchaeota archaeon]
MPVLGYAELLARPTTPQLLAKLARCLRRALTALGPPSLIESMACGKGTNTKSWYMASYCFFQQNLYKDSSPG